MVRHSYNIVCPTSQACHLHNLHIPLGVASHEKVSCGCSARTIPSSPPPLSSARGFGGGSERCGEKQGKKRDSQSLMSSGSSSPPRKENKRTLALAFTCNQCNGRSTLMVRGLQHHCVCVLFKCCCETHAPS